MNAWFDARLQLEMRCFVAYRNGVLLQYWFDCDDLRELETFVGAGKDKRREWSGVVNAVDEAAPLLFYLLRRPMFRETVNAEVTNL